MTTNLSRQRAPRPAWSSRQATVEDIPGINRLFAEVFGWTRDDAAVAWRYFANPAGSAVILLAEADNRIVGQCALWPTMLRHGGDRVLGAQSVDLMMHPAYRGLGIATHLAQQAYRLAAQHGIRVLYSFPNRNTLRASQSLGWSVIGESDTYSRPLRPTALQRVPTVLRPFVSVALLAWPRAGTSLYGCSNERPASDELRQLTELRHRDGTAFWQTEHQPEWYEWRFASAMGPYRWVTLRHNGMLDAFAIWGRSADGQSARIAEVVARSDEVLAPAIAQVARDAREAGCVTLEAMTNRPDIRRALQRNGFRHAGTLPFRVRSTMQPPAATLEDFKSWRLLGGDFDVF